MVLVNNGSNPDKIPSFTIEKYFFRMQTVCNICGCFPNIKLNLEFTCRIILCKARKNLIFFPKMIVSKQNWGVDTYTILIINIFNSFTICVCSRGLFNAPKYLLHIMQSCGTLISMALFEINIPLSIHEVCRILEGIINLVSIETKTTDVHLPSWL